MNRFSFRKTALMAFVILLLVVCVFFAYACEKAELPSDPTAGPVVELGASLLGEPYPGETLSLAMSIAVGEEESKPYDGEFSVRFLAGGEHATIVGRELRISRDAVPGEEIRFVVTAGGGSVTCSMKVLESAVESVTLLCDADRAAAGDVISLDAEVLPAERKDSLRYIVKEGSATVEGDHLVIGADADRSAPVVIVARAEGVESAEHRIAITTVQTTALTVELSAECALPGEDVMVTIAAQPADRSAATVVEITAGGAYAEWDETLGVLHVKEDAPTGSEIGLSVSSGLKNVTRKILVDHPQTEGIYCPHPIEAIVQGGTRSIPFTLVPANADRSKVEVSVLEGEEHVASLSGVEFSLRSGVPVGAEILFELRAGEASTTVTFAVTEPYELFISLKEGQSASYPKSGATLDFEHETTLDPSQENVTYGGVVYYRATKGADLVTISGSRVTVKEGADTGEVEIVATTEDGVVSNPVRFTVAGRYARLAPTTWSTLSFSQDGETPTAVWLILPTELDAGSLTVIVPAAVTDLLLEGHYDGTEASAYRNLYFYFRNAESRLVTFRNFATIATEGLGGTVMDLGSAGRTTVTLEGKNLVKADTPYSLDNSGEVTDGNWSTGESNGVLVELKRSGRDGYVGTAGGTAISGYELLFVGDGELTAVAGSGVDGTAGGAGADAVYDAAQSVYLSGAGGNGGTGGDSGYAIYASAVEFRSGWVTAVPGNAGKGGLGGAAGSLDDLQGKDVIATQGETGAEGRDGTPHPAVSAKSVTGDCYESSVGSVESLVRPYTGGFYPLTEKLSRFYGITIKYGTALQNPFANKLKKSEKYTMEQQTDSEVLLRQTNFLMYTLSRMSKNCWQEIYDIKGTRVTVYFCKKITDGYGSNILGLTSSGNNVWFATFDTEVRGVYYSGYFNIMLHEFVHVFHFALPTSERNGLEDTVQSYNYGLSYTTNTTTARVYGVTTSYDETNSCFLTAYSRKGVMEDVAETLSMPATFLSPEPPMTESCRIRTKYDYLVHFFASHYETLSAFTPVCPFGYEKLFN